MLALRQRGDEFETVQPGVLLDLSPSETVPAVPGALRDIARDDAAVAEASAVYANEYLEEVTNRARTAGGNHGASAPKLH